VYGECKPTRDDADFRQGGEGRRRHAAGGQDVDEDGCNGVPRGRVDGCATVGANVGVAVTHVADDADGDAVAGDDHECAEEVPLQRLHVDVGEVSGDGRVGGGLQVEVGDHVCPGVVPG